MIEIVINYDSVNNVFKVYEPTTDTLLITASITESFVKLSDFLQSQNMINSDILKTQEISYHIDSATFIAMVESNVKLMKRLNSSPSSFTTSSQRFGVSPYQANTAFQQKKNGNNYNGSKNKSRNKNMGTFSKTSFNSSNKKFGKI